MNRADVTALMSSVSVVVREFVTSAVLGVTERLDDLAIIVSRTATRLDALPVPENGKPGSSAFQIACLGGFQGSEGEWLESLRGKDAAVDVPAIVADVVAKIPVPEPGKAAEVDYERLAGMVTATVGAAVAALPVPKDGKSVDEAVVREMITAEAARAVLGIPPPEPGKADPVVVRTEVERAVAIAVAALPKPENGKDADPDDIAQAVADAVADIPRPKDADPVDYCRIGDGVKEMIAEAVAAIPAPKDGDSVDPAVVREMVVAEVSRSVALLPAPEPGKPGKSADAELVRVVAAELLPAMVDKAQAVLSERLDIAVAAEVAKIPPAKAGKDAEPVHPDTLALMVVTEVTKAVERAVAAIPKAIDGDDGRDAIQCEPLLSIDEAKSYPRGIYAAHRGGTIRSFRQTDPITAAGLLAAGWAVMANGVTSESEETIDDGRIDKRVTRYTDGTILERAIARAVVIDRGVYRDGEKYAKGDGVTWGGSFWIAQKDTDSKPDSADGSFRLAVKKGRDLTK